MLAFLERRYALIGLQDEALADGALLFVHSEGQLFEPFRTNEKFSFKGVRKETYRLSFTYNMKLPTADSPCVVRANYSFDRCVFDYAYSYMVSMGCLPSFYAVDNRTSTCPNGSATQEALGHFHTALWDPEVRSTRCPLPCHFYQAKISFEKIFVPPRLEHHDNHRYDYNKLTQTVLKVIQKVKRCM